MGGVKALEYTGTLDRATVLKVIEVIDGDGHSGLDLYVLVTEHGLPELFLKPLARRIRLSAIEAAMAGRKAGATVWSVPSLDLLRALVEHYGLETPPSAQGATGHSRIARALSALLTEHLSSPGAAEG